MRIGSPNNIEVLLHYHCSPALHPRHEAPAVQEAVKQLVEVGALKVQHVRDGYYNTTPLGKAWVQLLCNTHVPREVFVDENGEVIVDKQ